MKLFQWRKTKNLPPPHSHLVDILSVENLQPIEGKLKKTISPALFIELKKDFPTYLEYVGDNPDMANEILLKEYAWFINKNIRQWLGVE